MKTRKIILSLLATSILSTGVVAKENEKVLSLSTQPVPLSTAVSDEFYQFSARVPAANVEAMHKNIPQTKSDWKAFINKRDTAAIQAAKRLSEQFGTSIVEDNIAGVNVYWVTPKTINPELKDKLFVINQGGAFMLNSGLASTTEAHVIAHFLQMPVLAIDYAKAPEHPAPAARNEIVDVWKALLKTRSAESMVMGGSSAGATLTVLAHQELLNQGLPTAAALYIGTPSVDMTMTGDSRYYNEGLDHVLGTWRGLTGAMVNAYIGDIDPANPTVSPINGSFDNFPPSYLITGTRDLLLSDTIRLDRELKRAEAYTQLNVYEGQSHGDYIFALGTPESTEHYQALSEFMYSHLVK
ncbi:alpha/beta hydrolase [Photobacterium sp. SDRW27]|uniref:alpha/beta hydrolase fold domain-containing protein n=1 Tax=Photobacterium obscurum TaxID=2829490 RepID=UPI0022432D78|nr:alpha/beta hydrolase fold domain-containing protein [Photobacterium obscurum]MCW8329270.1 alpha/beta hydrolase [Photobacterium obscurum]